MYRSVMTRKRGAPPTSDGSDAEPARPPERVEWQAIRRPRASGPGGGRRLVCEPFMRKFLGWLSVAIAALLFVPALASAAFVLTGKTGQGLPVGLFVSRNLSAVPRFTIGWRAACSSGASFSNATLVGKPIAIRPFPNFHRTGSYVFSGVSNGQTYRAFVSAELHGALALGGRASGRWAAQVRVVDANGNQLAFCRSGVVRWRASL